MEGCLQNCTGLNCTNKATFICSRCGAGYCSWCRRHIRLCALVPYEEVPLPSNAQKLSDNGETAPTIGEEIEEATEKNVEASTTHLYT